MRPVSAVDQNGLWKNISVHYHSFISQQENNLAPEVISDCSEAMAVSNKSVISHDRSEMFQKPDKLKNEKDRQSAFFESKYPFLPTSMVKNVR